MKTFLLSIQVDELSLYTVNGVLYKTRMKLNFIQWISVMELICQK